MWAEVLFNIDFLNLHCKKNHKIIFLLEKNKVKLNNNKKYN